MKKRQKERIITFAGLGAIGVIITIVAFLQLENTKAQAFLETYNRLIADSRTLTQQYQNEVGKWEKKEYDNSTMISITDNYLPKFKELIDRAERMQPPDKYTKVQEFTTKSIQLEMESYERFRNFLATGNHEEDEKSTQLLSDALRYETDAFNLMKIVG